MAIQQQVVGGRNSICYTTGHHKPVTVAVYDLTANRAMMRVPQNPGAGEYAADEETGVYTFAAEDAGHFVLFDPAGPPTDKLLGP